jgi:hypothetical protein
MAEFLHAQGSGLTSDVMDTSPLGFDFGMASTLSETLRLRDEILTQSIVRETEMGALLRKIEADHEATRKMMAALAAPPDILAQIRGFDFDRTSAIVAGITESARLCTNLVSDSTIAAIRQISESFQSTSAISRILTATTPMIRLATFDYSIVSAAYCDFYEKLGAENTILADNSLLRIPARETFFSADSLLVFEDEEAEEADSERENLRADYHLHIEKSLEAALGEIAPEWGHSLIGARQVIESDNPDKVRAACASLRSLTLGVLEMLAPDERVQAWSDSKKDLRDGRPTVQARLRFVTDQLRCKPISAFLDADRVAVEHLLRVLNTGVHERRCELNLIQLRYTFRRVEGFLCAIVEAVQSR